MKNRHRTRLALRDYLSPSQHYHFARAEIRGRVYSNLHCHDFYEVFWIEDGEGFHSINGSERPLTRGAAFLVRPDDFHDFRAAEGRALRLANAAFSRTLFSALAVRYTEVKKLFAQPQAGREIAPGLLNPAFLSESAIGLQAGGGARIAIDRFLLNLASEIQHVRRKFPPMPDWLENACRGAARPEILIGGTRAFYRLAGRSPEHVIRETRRWLGLSPTHLINRERLRFAAEQLASTNRPISDIVAECGVENLSHFYRIFHAAQGCTPRQYRIRNQAIVLGRRAG